MGVEEAIDDLKDGALLGGRQLGEALEAFEEPRDFGTGGRPERLEAQQLIGGDPEGAGEIDEQGPGRLRAGRLVVGRRAWW